MGIPPRLNGEATPLPSEYQEICPHCGREFRVYDLVSSSNTKVRRECPYCGHKFTVNKSPSTSFDNR